MKILVIFLIPVFAMAKEINVNVKGMVCGFCAQGIEKKLKSEKGVKGVKVDLETKNVKVDLKDDADISNKDLIQILKDSGFNVDDSNITRNVTGDPKKESAK